MRKYAGNPWMVLLVVSLGFFMTLLDLTIVNIAIPNMITKLHASLDDVLWVINAYALVLAVLVITAGRLGDLIGPRIMFMGGVAVFTAASAACGLSPGPGWLIGFRAAQGLGAAMLMPQTLTIITNTFPPERRGAAFGVWGAVAGVATIAGPTLGGLLVTAFDWRWIFFVNLPIGVVVLLITPVIIPDLRLGRRHRIDVPGVLLASAALLAICYGLVEGQKYSWGTITSFISIPLILGLGVVLLIAFLVVQKLTQEREPLVPFAVFRDRNFSVISWVSGVLAVGMMGIFLPVTIFLQSVLGFSALKAGLTLAPASLLSMFVAPAAGRLTDKIGGKYILMSGLTLFAAGMGWLALIAHPSSSWQSFLAPLIVAGIGMGGTFAPMVTTAMRDIKPQMAGAASGVLNTVRQVGLVIGTAAVGALLQNQLVSSMTSQAATRSTVLPPQVRSHFIAGIRESAGNGIQVGAGQNGGVARQAGLPAHLAAEVARIGHDVFTFGFVDAMRTTMIMPVVLLAVGAVSCLAISRHQRAAEPGQTAEVPAAGIPAAQ
ncbi:MAG TPA: DHA2 family efflux MFS transporter permease subunit [Streptosporangiaceae bacterium]|nr:DHA2 family efflux MFS transporter permease subunit [Streptosporangiaceae bacterium]